MKTFALFVGLDRFIYLFIGGCRSLSVRFTVATFKTRENQRYAFHLSDRDVFWTSPVLLVNSRRFRDECRYYQPGVFVCSFVSIVYASAVLDSTSVYYNCAMCESCVREIYLTNVCHTIRSNELFFGEFPVHRAV